MVPSQFESHQLYFFFNVTRKKLNASIMLNLKKGWGKFYMHFHASINFLICFLSIQTVFFNEEIEHFVKNKHQHALARTLMRSFQKVLIRP